MDAITVSRYKDNKFSTKKKTIFAGLIDIFSVFILGFIIYCFVSPFVVKINAFQNIGNELNEVSREANVFISNTHLQFYDEEKRSLSDINEDGAKYIEAVVKTSSYVYNLEFPLKKEDGSYDIHHHVDISETFLEDASEYQKDNISYFFLKYKTTEESLNNYVVDGVDYSDNKEAYIYSKMMAYTESQLTGYFISKEDEDFIPYKDIISHYVVLEKTLTSRFINRLAYDDKSDASLSEINSIILSAYGRGISAGISQVENDSVAYNAIVARYNNSYMKLSKLYLAVYFITYLIGYLIYFGIGWLYAKRPITVGQKVMKTALCSNDEFEPRWWQLLIYHFVCFIFYISTSIIGLTFSGIIGAISAPLIGNLTLIPIILFALICDIGSLIFVFVSKKNRDIQCFLSLLVLKNVDEVEGSVVDGGSSK